MKWDFVAMDLFGSWLNQGGLLGTQQERTIIFHNQREIL
jgi:hypothetical protein